MDMHAHDALPHDIVPSVATADDEEVLQSIADVFHEGTEAVAPWEVEKSTPEELPSFEDSLDFLAALELDTPPPSDNGLFSLISPAFTGNPLPWTPVPCAPWPPGIVKSPPTSLSMDTSAPMPSNSTRMKRGRANKREELLYLRSTVSELEEKLSELQEKHAEKEEPTPDDLLIKSVWADVATRQHEQRRSAEEENAKLKMMLEEQIKVAKALEQLLRKRNNLELLSTSSTSSSGKRARIFSGKCPLDHDSILDELQGGLTHMYTQVDAMMADPRFKTSSTKTLRDIQLRSEASVGASVEIVESRVLPFDFRVTADAFWTIMLRRKHHTLLRKTYTEKIYTSTSDTLAKSFEGQLEFPRASADFRSIIVQKMFAEKNRFVFVGHMLSEPRRVLEKPMRGALMRHRGWSVIQPGPSPNTTLMQSYHVSTPELYEAVPDQRSMVGALTNFILVTVEVHLDLDIQELENHLLQNKKEVKEEEEDDKKIKMERTEDL
ncbi:hypothetical protein Poli38472_004869 [Pythium oligandrum]|uniref:Uncharacterized protein n=1 Tax=Pythium oligandrum TaxID=41045 RepID=A0A8K1CB05_PYTOL|nr:hypothetical protein Poli38472_004869 [Pythium oligandrum]|eukprot:TMW59800.1 hypothetical protein Poli38472_004869 [Pythium oligandrum]